MKKKNFLLKKLRNQFINWLKQEVEEPRTFPLSDFERIRYEIRPCDVLLIEGRTRVSQVIRLITQSTWSHSALYIGRLHDIEDPAIREHIQQFFSYDLSEQLVIESMLGKGIIISPLSNYRLEHIRICRPSGITRQDAQQVINYAANKLGFAYAFREIFDLGRFLIPWSFFPRRWRSSLFTRNPSASVHESCSSLIAEAFNSVDFPILPLIKQDEAQGTKLIQRNPRLFTPSDFDYSPFFSIIKYPIIELTEGANYRKLPWSKDGVLSNDEEKLGRKKKAPPQALDFFD